MFHEISELRLAQADGSLPTAVAAGSAPGESGVFVYGARFHGGGHISATPRLHHICFHVVPGSHFDCRIADQVLSHKPSRGCVAICPSGADYAAARRKAALSPIATTLNSYSTMPTPKTRNIRPAVP